MTHWIYFTFPGQIEWQKVLENFINNAGYKCSLCVIPRSCRQTWLAKNPKRRYIVAIRKWRFIRSVNIKVSRRCDRFHIDVCRFGEFLGPANKIEICRLNEMYSNNRYAKPSEIFIHFGRILRQRGYYKKNLKTTPHTQQKTSLCLRRTPGFPESFHSGNWTRLFSVPEMEVRLKIAESPKFGFNLMDTEAGAPRSGEA